MSITEQASTPFLDSVGPAKVTRIGNLTRTPTLRFSAKGTSWTTTALRVDRRTRKEDGTWEDLPSEFYDVVAFGVLAESVAESLATGDRVIVVGRVEGTEWTGRDGAVRTGWKIVADDVGASLRHGPVVVDRITRNGSRSDSVARALEATSVEELLGEVES
ncbi:MAG: single-stranded DNA-binding protein [Acidimicrobiales bacterium]